MAPASAAAACAGSSASEPGTGELATLDKQSLPVEDFQRGDIDEDEVDEE